MIEAILLKNLALLAAVVGSLWTVCCLLRNVNLVDIFGGLGFVLLAWLSLLFGERFLVRPMALTAMVTIWGIRLSGYLAWRNLGKAEDYRYAAMREKHGNRFAIVSLFTVFVLQGALMWIIALPIQIGILTADEWQTWRWLGAAVWLAGLLFESIGDYQLAAFKANPAHRGQVMNRGLWRFTRHPNYFGDFLVWWGLFLVAAQTESWWWTIVAPALMSFLLIRVSGVRLLESSLRQRIAGYEDYVARTSSFIPWPPGKGNGE
jgi:steroid 5-alpha reductase family enzyme